MWSSSCQASNKSGVHMLERVAELWREVGHGVRLFRKNPGFTLIVGITLSLGIGATTAIFTVLYATVLAPLRFADSDRLVMFQQRNAEGRLRVIPVDRLEAWRKESKTLEGIT